MRKPALLAALLLVAVLGFYAGAMVLPGVFGQGAGAIVPAGKTGEAGNPAGESPIPPKEQDPEPEEGELPPETPASEDPPDPPGGSDKYWIDVDVTAQVVKVFEGEEVIKTMTASTGVEGHETPLGTFQIQNRGDWFFTEKYSQGAKYWVSFKDWGVYLFHSLAMDRDKNIIPEEAEKLGQPASHGCIRLQVEDAKWIYETIPARSKVVIHE